MDRNGPAAVSGCLGVALSPHRDAGVFPTSSAESPRAQPPSFLRKLTPLKSARSVTTREGLPVIPGWGLGGEGEAEGEESQAHPRGTYHEPDTRRLPCPQEVKKTSASQQEISNHFSDTKATGMRCRSEEEGLQEAEPRRSGGRRARASRAKRNPGG